ncbi:TPA: hypothetical protein ACHJY3_005081, partial [Escherichia coli]
KYTHNHLQVNNVINNQKHCKEHVMWLIFYVFYKNQKWAWRRESEAGYNKVNITDKDVNRNEENADTVFYSGDKHAMQND